MKNKFGYYDALEIYMTLISKIVETTSCEIYLELGVLQGLNIKEARKYCNRCIGVDIRDILLYRDFEFHLKSTDEFFKTFKESPNIIFIDADHNFEQVKKDFTNSLNCLSKYGIIILHDTDPADGKYLVPSHCGDSYKIHNWIKTEHPELNILTLPIGTAGLTIINRENDRRVLNFLKT